mgnify:FL=1|tara:strand:- start:4923 stop:5333 length:411 start_codon:yes stop_codon:yes gene_type:complete
MSLKANIRIGDKCSIVVEAADPVDLIKRASQFTQLPQKCGHCVSDNLSFMHRTAGGSDEFDYLHVKCNECGAQCDLGQKKKPLGDIFFRHQPKDRSGVKDGFYKYWEQDKQSSSSQVPGDEHPVEVDSDPDDEIPF